MGIVVACAVLAALVVGATNAITILSTRDNVHTVAGTLEAAPEADAIVVLGASVRPDGTPSDMLRDRLDTAIALYDAGAAPKIIVSGDNRTSHYNETQAMKRYCVEHGVPSKDVFEDHAGYSTYESMYRARHVFGADSIIVTTQGYHLYRAMFAAQQLGMEAYGVASDHGLYENQNYYSLREMLARTKDFFAALFSVPINEEHQPIAPEGESYNLEGSGDAS